LKLDKSGTTKYLWDTLTKLLKAEIFRNYYLVGGTAYSLQIGHRISDDIDLFTPDKLDKEMILDFVQNEISNNFGILKSGNSIYQLYNEKEKLKLDFVCFPYKLLDPLLEIEGIRMINKNDLSAMKVSAVGTRGNEAKDFYDLYCLLKEMSIEKIFENFQKKYGMDNFWHYQKSVVYFDDVEDSSWNGLRFLKENVSKDTITCVLTQAVIEYERNNLIKRNTH